MYFEILVEDQSGKKALDFTSVDIRDEPVYHFSLLLRGAT